jgi:DNA-binding LacI/PurR family transcriptional regulator
MKKRTTVADVARVANVSMMTVSRVMNDKPGVRNELRQKILEIAAEMEYHPNKVARGLATRRTAPWGWWYLPSPTRFMPRSPRALRTQLTKGVASVFLVNTAANLAREEAKNSLGAEHRWRHPVQSYVPKRRCLKALSAFSAAVLFNRELEEPLLNVVTIRVNDQRARKQFSISSNKDGGVSPISAPPRTPSPAGAGWKATARR